jgi:hypothetical protein
MLVQDTPAAVVKAGLSRCRVTTWLLPWDLNPGMTKIMLLGCVVCAYGRLATEVTFIIIKV